MRTPLFEEERHGASGTLVTNPSRPVRLHGSRSMPGLSTYYHPVDTTEVQVEGSEQRFAGQESDCCRDFPKMHNPGSPSLVLNTRTKPNVRRPRQLRRQSRRTLGAFGKHLIRMVRPYSYGFEHSCDEAIRNIGMKQIAHRIDEDETRAGLAQREVEPVRPKLQVEGPVRTDDLALLEIARRRFQRSNGRNRGKLWCTPLPGSR